MENAIKIQLPVTVSYAALEAVIQQQMTGDYIPPRKPGETSDQAYAQILDIRIAGTSTDIYDLILDVKLNVLRTVLKRKPVDLQVMAVLGYDKTTQILGVRKFRVEVKTSSRFYNSSLELLANKVAYNQIINKARINLKELIAKELKKANGLLANGLDLKGLKLSGVVEEVQLLNISPQQGGLLLELLLQANLEAAVLDLLSLLPPKP